MIQKSRIFHLNKNSQRHNSYVLYWMQQSQRDVYNHALEYAVMEANRMNLPLIVLFCLIPDFPDANCRHYTFMAEGLVEVKKGLYERGINMYGMIGNPVKCVASIAQDASLLITDRGYLRFQRQWRQTVSELVKCQMVEIESDCIVPVETASQKEQYSAGTLRPKIQRVIKEYLIPVKPVPLQRDSLSTKCDAAVFPVSTQKVVKLLKPDMSVPPLQSTNGGHATAIERLENFINHKLDKFGELRNDPSLNYCSGLSPFIHFGQISTLQIALEVKNSRSPGKDSFLEELIIRRELAYNFVWYNKDYDSFQSLPSWAANTLKVHQNDKRKPVYGSAELERAATADPYWNAAQREMMIRGKMHGYMRMYWGKKLIEWMKTPQEAYSFALYLNNKYELDGRDPNGYAGIAWCFGKHDRAWKERPIFGKIRYMNASGLERKFAIDAYVSEISMLPEINS